MVSNLPLHQLLSSHLGFRLEFGTHGCPGAKGVREGGPVQIFSVCRHSNLGEPNVLTLFIGQSRIKIEGQVLNGIRDELSSDTGTLI